MNGSVTDLALHMIAVEKMVTAKGGLRVLGMQSVLHMLISWYSSPKFDHLKFLGFNRT